MPWALEAQHNEMVDEHAFESRLDAMPCFHSIASTAPGGLSLVPEASAMHQSQIHWNTARLMYKKTMKLCTCYTASTAVPQRD